MSPSLWTTVTDPGAVFPIVLTLQVMLAILYLVYQITFVMGDVPRQWMDALFAWLGNTAEALLPEGLFRSLVVSGVINGIGGVIGFVPLIMLIFLQIAFLEDSGYMARVAYMLDRVFRIFGLHGCSVMPFVISGGIGGGCAVPGVMASRTLRSPREKLATMLTAPFMTCGAKLPVFLLLVGVFFPKREAVVLFCITLAGWLAALFAARLLRSTVISGPPTPFVMELPPYRLPTARGMVIHTWERTWQYIKKAGTVILAISILLWAAMDGPNFLQGRAKDRIGDVAAFAVHPPAEGAGTRIVPAFEGFARQDQGLDCRQELEMVGAKAFEFLVQVFRIVEVALIPLVGLIENAIIGFDPFRPGRDEFAPQPGRFLGFGQCVIFIPGLAVTVAQPRDVLELAFAVLLIQSGGQQCPLRDANGLSGNFDMLQIRQGW